jgi:hypothetical protein
MASNEERMQILKMIEEGKISATEGAALLRALSENDNKQQATVEPLKGASTARWLRVRITDTRTGRQKVNVNIPIGLVNVGLKMGARFVPEMESAEYAEVIAAIQSGQQGKIIEVDDQESGERVELFVE